MATTIISFLPVFTMEAAEGKLFRPLAFTKTFALVAAIFVSIAFLPALADQLFGLDRLGRRRKILGNVLLATAGVAAWVFVAWWLGAIALLAALLGLANTVLGGDAGAGQSPAAGSRPTSPAPQGPAGGFLPAIINVLIALTLAWLLAGYWLPLGVERTQAYNFLFVVVVAGGLLGFFWLVIHFYGTILRFLLRVKFLFLLLIALIITAGVGVYQNIGEEFMPALGEGTFLLMPTAMPHAGIAENLNNLRTLDMALTTIPEVDMVVGKAGRVNSPLDPAPLSMYENIVQYKSEYATDADGRRLRFRVDEAGNFVTRSDATPLDGGGPSNG